MPSFMLVSQFEVFTHFLSIAKPTTIPLYFFRSHLWFCKIWMALSIVWFVYLYVFYSSSMHWQLQIDVYCKFDFLQEHLTEQSFKWTFAEFFALIWNRSQVCSIDKLLSLPIIHPHWFGEGSCLLTLKSFAPHNTSLVWCTRAAAIGVDFQTCFQHE